MDDHSREVNPKGDSRGGYALEVIGGRRGKGNSYGEGGEKGDSGLDREVL